RAETLFVGREVELALLERELDAALAKGRCRLVTAVGEPGVGKSRLTAELIDATAARARAVRGACLSYGEGITYWAVRQIVKERAGIRDEPSQGEMRAQLEAALAGTTDAGVVANQLLQLLGVGEGTTTPEELAWATRRFLAVAAARGPLLVLV